MKTKLTDWNIQDYLKTPEDRALYIESAIAESAESNDMGFLATAFEDVAQAIGNGNVAIFMAGISTGLRAAPIRSTSSKPSTRAKSRA